MRLPHIMHYIIKRTRSIIPLILFLFILSALNNSAHAQSSDFSNKVDELRDQQLTQAETTILFYLNRTYQHVSGQFPVPDSQLALDLSSVRSRFSAFGTNADLVDLGFDVIDSYDSNNGAVFTQGSESDGGIPRTASGNETEHTVLAIMQAILDFGYTESNLAQNPTIFNNRKFETSSFFPGAVDVAPSDYTTCNVRVNGTHVKGFGIPANAEEVDARRPTGCYLAPGAVAQITVPQSLVNIGASVLVGTHTWDLSSRPTIFRMDRISKQYDINDTTITVGNPLGGGIYINIPYQTDLGILNIEIDNVVRSPYFANTVANQTSVAQWQNTERHHPVPWTDIETENVMFQVPTSWINAVDDPSQAVNDWDAAVDAISELFDRPSRPKTAIYAQVDITRRGSAFFPGYPQSNDVYNPDASFNGNHNHILIRGPRGRSDIISTLFFHEIGHQEGFYKLRGEIESAVYLLYVAIHNKMFGVDINEAFGESINAYTHSIEEAAQSWMITENFRSGNPMSTISGDFRQEFSHQPRGHAKYADIVRMFGWETIEQFHHSLNLEYESGVRYPFDVNSMPWDQMILGMSITSGHDLRPLFHFWGIHPENPTELAASINANNLESSAAIYDQLAIYKTIVPENNAAFRAFGLEDFDESEILNFVNPFNHRPSSYYEGFLNAWWFEYDTSHAQDAEEQVQSIIDLYFPNGRPTDGTTETPNSTVVQWVKSNASNFAIDGDRDGANGQNIYLFRSNPDNINQQWVEIDRGQGYYSYQKQGTNFCIDGDRGGQNGQNVYLWTCQDDNQNQHWRKVNVGGGNTRLEKRNAPNFSIDGDSGGQNFQNVYLWRSNDNNGNQQWQLVPIDR